MHRMPASPTAFYGHAMNVAYAAIPIQPPPHMLPQPLPPPVEKRPLEQADEEAAPKTKKNKKATKSTEGTNGSGKLSAILTKPQSHVVRSATTSRRGYNAKKRSEAAQIAAQNGTLRVTRGYHESDNGTHVQHN